jgi:FkbM family methyltransferase
MLHRVKRLGQLYSQFPLGTATRITVCDAVRAIFDPCRQCGYAQTGEDRIIQSYLDLKRPGFYIDVGCNHPFSGSNTANLYSQGWNGIVIDGNPEMVELFKRFRPRDTAICVVVSSEARPLTYTLARVPELSTVSREFEKKWIDEDMVIDRIKVDPVRLQKIMREHNVPGRFDLLAVDVEGHDYEVLTSFEIEEFRPILIVVEMHGFDLARPDGNRIYDYLVRNGYCLKSYSVVNGIFMDARR